MEELRFVKKIASIAVVGMGAVFFVIVILVSKYIPDVFGMQMESQAYFGTGMAVSAVSFLFTGLAKFHISYLNATLQVKKAMQLIYGETIVVAPFLIFLLPYVFKINGIWLSLPGTQLIMLLIFNVFRKVDFINALYNAFRKGESYEPKEHYAKAETDGRSLVVCHTSPDPADRFLDLSNIQVFIYQLYRLGLYESHIQFCVF